MRYVFMFHRTRSFRRIFILLAILAFITALISGLRVVTLEHWPPDDFTRVGYGRPVTFIFRDFITIYTPSSLAIPDGYTRRTEIIGKFFLGEFLLNFSIHFIVLTVPFTLFRKYNPLRR